MKLARKIILMMMAAFIGSAGGARLLATVQRGDRTSTRRSWRRSSSSPVTPCALRWPRCSPSTDRPARSRSSRRPTPTIEKSAIHWVTAGGDGRRRSPSHQGCSVDAGSPRSLMRRGRDHRRDRSDCTCTYRLARTAAPSSCPSRSIASARGAGCASWRTVSSWQRSSSSWPCSCRPLAGVRFIGTPMRKLTAHARSIGTGDLLPSPVDRQQRRDRRAGHGDEPHLRSPDRRRTYRAVTTETSAKLKALEQLRHADRLSTVGSLASGMAHELGTPLAVIGGRAKMIATGQA